MNMKWNWDDINKMLAIGHVLEVMCWLLETHQNQVIVELSKSNPLSRLSKPELPEIKLGQVTCIFFNMKNSNYPKSENFTRSAPQISFLYVHQHVECIRLLAFQLVREEDSFRLFGVYYIIHLNQFYFPFHSSSSLISSCFPLFSLSLDLCSSEVKNQTQCRRQIFDLQQ